MSGRKRVREGITQIMSSSLLEINMSIAKTKNRMLITFGGLALGCWRAALSHFCKSTRYVWTLENIFVSS